METITASDSVVSGLADHIDSLLERYLPLLHDYTALREELNALQTGMYQSLARANFAAERGVRFGQDYYDDRMQASRRVVLRLGGENADVAAAAAAVTTTGGANGALSYGVFNTQQASDKQEGKDKERGTTTAERALESDGAEKSNAKTGDSPSGTGTTSVPDAKPEDQEEPSSPAASPPPKHKREQKRPAATDPIRWFGLLTPAALRQAQAQSVRVVEDVVPRLASVSAAMAQLEIEIRRARKRRGKALAAAKETDRGLRGNQEKEQAGTTVAV